MLEIAQERIDNEELTWFEAKYLRDRGRLPVGYPFPEEDETAETEPVVPVSRVTPLEEQSELEIEETDEPARELLPSKATPLEEQSEITIGEPGGIMGEDEESDYLDGWNNDQRRGELSKRGLSVEGRKDDLIARLRRSDIDALLPEDAGREDDTIEDEDDDDEEDDTDG